MLIMLLVSYGLVIGLVRRFRDALALIKINVKKTYHTSSVMTHFVLNFVAIRTGVSWWKFSAIFK